MTFLTDLSASEPGNLADSRQVDESIVRQKKVHTYAGFYALFSKLLVIVCLRFKSSLLPVGAEQFVLILGLQSTGRLFYRQRSVENEQFSSATRRLKRFQASLLK